MKLNYCTESGIDFYIYFQRDFATIVVPHDGQMTPLLKTDLEEMSFAARLKGVNKVDLETNYGLEIHSTESLKCVGIDKFRRLKYRYRIKENGKYLNAWNSTDPTWFHLHEAREIVKENQMIVEHDGVDELWEIF